MHRYRHAWSNENQDTNAPQSLNIEADKSLQPIPLQSTAPKPPAHLHQPQPYLPETGQLKLPRWLSFWTLHNTLEKLIQSWVFAPNGTTLHSTRHQCSIGVSN